MRVATWDETWMEVARVIGLRSKCVRRQIGAVIVSPTNRIIATGYTGAPAGAPEHNDCTAVCARAWKTAVGTSYADCVSVHAEANALLFCDRRDREGGTLYVTSAICWDCAKMIANSGLTTVHMIVAQEDAHRNPSRSIEFMRQCGMTVEVHST